MARLKTKALPVVERVAYFRCAEGDLVRLVSRAVVATARDDKTWEPQEIHGAIIAWSALVDEVPNGGLEQFFYNRQGDWGIKVLCTKLRQLGETKLAGFLDHASKVYRANQDKFNVDNPFDGLFGSITEFKDLDRKLMNAGVSRAAKKWEDWIREHLAELVVGDDGAVIDTAFTGSVQRMHPNGSVAETLDVKKGKAHGAYREFFDDGSLRQALFYKAGKESGDFWPDGTVKFKKSTSKGLTIYEWFYPSGKLQKRMVQFKTGYNAEPVRLYYENGQLAEELHTKDGKRLGPWKRFFEDGKPALDAEYGEGRWLVVFNAWNAERQQVVKDGKGVFDDDIADIDWQYSLSRKSMWRRVSELEGGIPHGKVTTYANGVLWSVNEYFKGKVQGKCITYWDNGRVRTIEMVKNGTELSSESFPKFDKPVPVVLLKVHADAELYSAWKHMPVDEYPEALNMEEIQAELKMPQMLKDVHERNLQGAVSKNYEDWNTFNDGIGYFAQVDAEGKVLTAQAHASGVYSGGLWDTYVPLIKRLKFKPGRVKGRPVECRVVVHIDHTFVEGRQKPTAASSD